jgi:hypothetical protein
MVDKAMPMVFADSSSGGSSLTHGTVDVILSTADISATDINYVWIEISTRKG